MISLKWNGTQWQNDVLYNYYYIVAIIYTLAVFVPFVKTGLLMSCLLLYLCAGFRFLQTTSFCLSLAFFYLLYNVMTVQGYIFNNIPITVFFQEFANQVLPISFFFIAYNGNVAKEKFYKTFVISMLYVILIGLYFHIFTPASYIRFVSSTSNSTIEGQIDAGIIRRFGSIFGSTIMGTMAIILICLAIYRFWNLKIKENLKEMAVYIIAYFLGFSAVFMTLQRSAIIMGVLVISFFLLLSVFKHRGYSFIIINIVCILFISISLVDLLPDFFQTLEMRFESMSEGQIMDDRDQQWLTTFANSPNVAIGTGLGSAGHRAAAYTKYFISDGAIFKIIAEFGYIGFSLFSIFLAVCLIPKLKFFSTLFREYLIVGACLAQSIGSNTLTFQVVLPIFWFSIGIIASHNKNKEYECNSVLSSTISSN